MVIRKVSKMIREYAYDPEEFLFFCEETGSDFNHPVTTGYENLLELVEGDLDAASIEALILEFFS